MDCPIIKENWELKQFIENMLSADLNLIFRQVPKIKGVMKKILIRGDLKWQEKKKVSQQIGKNIKSDLGIPIAFLIRDK